MEQRRILWTPPIERAEKSTIHNYEKYLSDRYNLSFSDYNEMWRWSISDLTTFWSSISDYFGMRFFSHPEKILNSNDIMDAVWFDGAELNFSDQMLNNCSELDEKEAFVCVSETFDRRSITWKELRDKTTSVAIAMKDMGVKKGDRVACILPNSEEALIAFLAAASLGAIWSLCSLDMGYVSVLDRFKQIQPKLLIAQDGYVLRGRFIDRKENIKKIREGLNNIENFIMVSALSNSESETVYSWPDLFEKKGKFVATPVPFNHPLWVVYSSGTTGTPKPIVHGHGGILLEGMKQSLHHDLTKKDRFSWLTSSGWIMWNAQWVALGQGATVVAFDGAPDYPNMNRVWEFISAEKLSFFGAGAAFFESSMKAKIIPKKVVDFKNLRSIGSTGSPLSGQTFEWIYQNVKLDLWVAPISGGTDLCGGFVMGHPKMPVRRGEMQCRALGNSVKSFSSAGEELLGEVGELVCTKPLPSMPLYFWGDQKKRRYKESYFDFYPGIWRHGDWIKIYPDGSSVIFGRSDATINRKGLRIGSAEIYQAVESLDEVKDSLIVDLEYLEKESFMPLFIVKMPNVEFNEELKNKINEKIKTNVSPRFLPDTIIEVMDIPKTLSGKKLEVPVKNLMLGCKSSQVINKDAMVNPSSIDFYIDFAKRIHK